MKTISRIILTVEVLGLLMSFAATALAAGDDGKEGMLERLRRETVPALKQTGRPTHLFRLDPLKTALVIIDMQNFSCVPPGEASMPGITSAVSSMNRLADHCRSLGIPVIWVRQNISCGPEGDTGGLYGAFHGRDHVNSICNKGKGTEIFRGMHFDPVKDHVVFKNRYSAFLSDPPELKRKLDTLKRNQLIMAGVAANVCVESTVRDAMQLDYEVTVVADATTSPDTTLLKGTLKNTMLFFGDVRSTDEVVEELKRNRSRNGR
jgi:ureidoacrylate peracid hydrolase